MSVLSTVFPVFFMLGLGFAARVNRWISQTQRDGLNALVFTVLFPIMIFNLIFSASFQMQYAAVILYVLVIYLLAMLVGKLFSGFTGKEYSHFSNLLLATNEGGSVALPLYLSIVGHSSTTVIFDLAGTIVCFIILPILVQKKTSGGTSLKEMLLNMISNSFVVAVALGLVMNFLGLYHILEQSAFYELYTSTVSMATDPIVGVILFGIGYDLKLDKETVKPVMKLMTLKTVYYALVIAGFFFLFPSLMAEKTFLLAVLIYFMSPTGFGLLPVISPLYQHKNDAAYASAYTSLYMIVTLVVFVFAAVFIA